MGIAKKLLQLVKTTGQLDARGRKPGGTAKPPAAPPAAASLPPLGERRTERRIAGTKPERPSKPKYVAQPAVPSSCAEIGLNLTSDRIFFSILTECSQKPSTWISDCYQSSYRKLSI